MSLAGVAKETLAIIERGHYRSPSGSEVQLRDAIDAAVRQTALFTPEQLTGLLAGQPAAAASATSVEVTAETTAQAARRLVEQEAAPAPPASLLRREPRL